jgi:hypothetical protein
MVNYFRAFQWKDPFRFKCVHEDDLINRFQVNNKTNSVAAYCMRLYALRYQEGICAKLKNSTFPDANEVQNRSHSRHLFVAASNDLRSTSMQPYILDLVLSCSARRHG